MAVTEGLDYMPLEGRLGSGSMEGSSNAPGVTPEGVRAGDRAALQALVDRRGPAVVAFCTQVCGPQAAERAAAEAFARFRAAVRDAHTLSGLDPEALLRGATRHAAASMARQPSGPPPHGRLRSRGTQNCEHVPTMLAARANGALGDADVERLGRHLERCERCNALAEIFHRAEMAYQDPAIETLGSDTTTVLVAALESVSERGVGTAPAPAHDVPAGVAMDGAFGHLPDLEDEVPIEVVPAVVEPEAVEAAAAVVEPEAVADLVEVEHVDDPVAELDPEALAAEPLPEDEPPVPEGPVFYATAEHDAVDLGETVEWDEIPDAPGEHEGVVAGPAAAAPLLEGGHTRRSRPRPLAVALPVLLVAACIAGALALAGVFGGNDPTPPVERTSVPRVEAPVLTPLPVKVKAPAPAAAVTPSTAGTAGTTSGAATTTGAAGTTPGTGTTPGASTATP